MDTPHLPGDAVGLRIIKAKTGSQGAEIAVRLNDGRTVTCIHWLTQAAEARTWKVLDTLGFNGDFEHPAFGIPACAVEEREETYNDRTVMKYRIVTDAEYQPLARSELAVLSGRWARRGGRTPPAGPAPKPPAAPPPQPPPAGAGGAEQQDSGIPF